MGGNQGHRDSANRASVWAPLALAIVIIASAVPVWVPVPASPLAPPKFDASLVERLFPGVPPLWVALRLSLLCAVAFIAAWFSRGASAANPNLPHGPWPAGVEPRAPLVALAAGLALAQLGLAVLAEHLPRPLQLTYLALVLAPAAVLALDGRYRPKAYGGTPWPAIVLLAAIWLVIRLPAALESAWIANAVDARMPFAGLQRTLSGEYNLLTDQLRPGYTAALSILQGPTLLGLAPEDLTTAHMLIVQTFWIAVAGCLLGWVLQALFSRTAAIVGVAFFLFSPFTMVMTLYLGALFLGPLIPITLIALAIKADRDHRAWAIAAFGGVAGLSCKHPSLVPFTLLLGMLLLARLIVRDAPRRSTGIGLVSFVAGAFPGLPTLSALRAMSGYASNNQMWSGMEAVGFGFVAPSLGHFQTRAGEAGPLDAALGTLLSPVATPRTALRLWGDVMYEPLGAGLFIVGIVLCLRFSRRSWLAPATLVFMLISLSPGFISSYDRASLTRPFASPVAATFTVAMAFAWLVRDWSPARRNSVAAIAAAAITASGLATFDLVNPRILTQSPLGIAIELLRPREHCPRFRMLVSAAWDPLRTSLFGRNLAKCDIVVEHLEDSDPSVLALPQGGEVVLWTLGIEEDFAVASTACQATPQPDIIAVRDLSGTNVLLAMTTGDAQALTASLETDRWRPVTCETPVPTEANRGQHALTLGRKAWANGRRAEAVDQMRRAASRLFSTHDLFVDLAERLLDNPELGSAREAHYWARRAAVLRRYAEPDSLFAAARAAQAAAEYEDAQRWTELAIAAAEASDDRDRLESILHWARRYAYEP